MSFSQSINQLIKSNLIDKESICLSKKLRIIRFCSQELTQNNRLQTGVGLLVNKFGDKSRNGSETRRRMALNCVSLGDDRF